VLAAEVHDGLGERRRRFLGKVVSDASGDQPELVLARELLRVVTRLGVRRSVGITLHRDVGTVMTGASASTSLP